MSLSFHVDDVLAAELQLCAISNLTCENYNMPLAIMPSLASQASDSVAPVFPSEYLESDVLEMPLSEFVDPGVPFLARDGGLTCDRQIPYQSSGGDQPSSNLSSSFPSEPTFVEGVTLTGESSAEMANPPPLSREAERAARAEARRQRNRACAARSNARRKEKKDSLKRALCEGREEVRRLLQRELDLREQNAELRLRVAASF
jgi:hypothetical protein